MIGLSGKPREIGAFFMYIKLKNLYITISSCIENINY